MSEAYKRKGGTNISISGENNGQVINNENGIINNNFHYSGYSSYKSLKPEKFIRQQTEKTPETERLKAIVQVTFEILAFIVSTGLFNYSWWIALIVLFLILGITALTWGTFSTMDKLKRQRFSEPTPLMAIKYPEHFLLLDENNKIVLCEIIFKCPKCGSKMKLTPKVNQQGYSLKCPRNDDHSFTTFDYTMLDNF